MIKRLAVFLFLFPLAACGSRKNDQALPPEAAKIKFDLSQFDAAGLRGPPDGKMVVDYEFCIPKKEEFAKEIRTIDPSAKCFSSSKGRIGCTSGEYLCIGNTHQRNYRKILLRLARLGYIQRIEETFYE